MSDQTLKINDQIQIMISDESLYAGRYYSHVEDFTDEGIVLSLPLKEGEIIPLHIGEKVEFCKITDSAIWLYRGTIIQRQGSPLPLMTVKLPLKVEKLQRRNFYRLPLSVQTQFAKVEEDKPMNEWQWEPSYLRNLSGGGVCLSCETQLEIGQQIVIDVPLEQDILRLWGEIRRVEQSSSYVAGVEFLDILHHDQDRIVQYVFAKQRAIAQKNKSL
ncbi:flagellar brake protein [Heliophilum fasciatum]|uniref:C-di-GMP-binding flagellar brake protein YcgR n=1 Tax=Heliophilum fasciatum TaxID=35700 RepID=A0A4V6NRL9_9FIRM|nr:flagellar brake domain-containing protein [Heliophilum fasciatum]MCW2278795.1 c-di-GMP-binding flagellar brake protein YcgR [Heliophilum fasciatum]TCP62466.1 c-di-GMP-binding flagellar brake protein YcgR [Heliophilum fasciatum]